MKVKDLIEQWELSAAEPLTVEEYRLRLPVHDAARVRALAEMYPRRPLDEILTADGHRVLTTDSGRDALKMLGEQDLDIILCDLRMPKMDGRRFYETLKQERPDLVDRIAFVTGDTLSAGIESFLDTAGCPTIEKPFAPEEVLETVRARLACAQIP